MGRFSNINFDTDVKPNPDQQAGSKPKPKPEPKPAPKPAPETAIPPSLERPIEYVEQPTEPTPAPRRQQVQQAPVIPQLESNQQAAQATEVERLKNMVAEQPVSRETAPTPPPDALKTLAGITAPTQIGSATQGVEPGFIADKVTGEFIEAPERADEDEEFTPLASRPLSGLSSKELKQLAIDRATAELKPGEELATRKVNAKTRAITAEINSYKKRDVARAAADKETAAKRAAKKVATPPVAQEAVTAGDEEAPRFSEVFDELRSGKVACFTGHRTASLNAELTGSAAYDETTKAVNDAKANLEKAIDLAYEDGYRTFITGLAQGIDQWAAEILIEKKKTHPDIVIIGAAPYLGQESVWPKQAARDRYWDIVDAIDGAGVVSGPVEGRDARAKKADAVKKLQVRNEAMVNSSDLVIAIYKGGTGGTANAIEYAKAQGKEVLQVNPDTGTAKVYNRPAAAEPVAENAEVAIPEAEPRAVRLAATQAPVAPAQTTAEAMGLTPPADTTFTASTVVETIETPEQAEAVAEAVVNREPLPPEVEKAVAAEVVNEVAAPKKPRKPRKPKPPKPPTNGPEVAEPTPEPEVPGESTIYSRAFQRVVTARNNIRTMLAMPTGFQLSGDFIGEVPVTVDGVIQYRKNGQPQITKARMHQDPVLDKIKEAFEFFGREYKEEDEVWLFRAFMLYRGYSVDRENFIFNTDPDKVKISDKKFIAFLSEIMSNVAGVEGLNHPFAYSNAGYKIGGTECYPLPTTRGVARFFTEVKPEDGNRLKLSFDEFVAYSMNEYTKENGVRDTMMQNADVKQQEALNDFVDVIAESWGEDSRTKDFIRPRTVNSRLSADEMFDLASAYATSINFPTEIALVLKEWYREAEQARVYTEKLSKRLPTPKKQPKGKKLKGKEIEQISFWGHVSEAFENPPDTRTVIATLNTIARTSQVAAMPVLAVTGVAEHGIGVFNQSAGQHLLSKNLEKKLGYEVKATEGGLELIVTEDNMYAMNEQIGILASRGGPALVQAVNTGTRFTAQRKIGKGERIREWLMKLSIGDVAFQERVAKIFMEHLVYQFARSEILAAEARKKDPGSTRPIISIPAARLEDMLRTNPDAFWSMVAKTKEGRQALNFAANTSLNGVDPLTSALRKITVDPINDFIIGFFGGYFLKYATRSMLRRVSFSTTLLYLAKRGITDNLKLMGAAGLEAVGVGGMVEKAEQSNAQSNELLLGGNEEFADGLGQVLLLDIARLPSQVAVFALVATVVALLGVEPPDDEELDHLWYEYKIGGTAAKSAWYWTELLGFTMPLVISSAIALEGPESWPKAKDVLVHGLMDELENGAWMNVADTIDLLTRYDAHLIEAQARSEGHLSDAPVSEPEYGRTLVATFLGKRLYQSFEPAIARAIWNEAGIDSGREKLAHSTNVVYSRDPGDTEEGKFPRVESTSWSDAQLRKMAYPSPTMGFFLNLFGGYFINNDEEQKTGYWKYQMPYITNADPFQAEMMADLVVLDDDGENVPYDKWTDAQKQAIGNTVIDYVTNYSPSQLAANGVVLPYDARMTAKDLLDIQWRSVEDEYRARVASGEFNWKLNGLSYEENYSLKDAAWNEKDAAQTILEQRADAIWSDDIPYSPTVYNRWETSFRPLYVWKEGTEREGQPATKMDWRLNRDEVEVSVYASGDHKSGFWPTSWVDDQGQNTYNAETKAAWQTPDTQMDFVRSFAEGNPIAKGMNEGEDLWSIVGPGVSKLGTWDNGKLVMGVRAMVPAEMPHKKVEPDDKILGLNYVEGEAAKTPTDGSSSWSDWGSGGGGGGGYSPKLYSHAAYSLNPDKPAGLYSKTPSYARFDYLRPSVKTKGSREAYRREDF